MYIYIYAFTSIHIICVYNIYNIYTYMCNDYLRMYVCIRDQDPTTLGISPVGNEDTLKQGPVGQQTDRYIWMLQP